MPRRAQSIFACCVLTLVACSDAVDPGGTFTVQGQVLDVHGDPARDVELRVLRRDVELKPDPNILHYQDVLSGARADAIFSVVSDDNGEFVLPLSGTEVNDALGERAGWLAVVYFHEGDARAYLAAASDWHRFDDADRVWDIGPLSLWDPFASNPAGRQGSLDVTEDAVALAWGATLPESSAAATGVPDFVFVFAGSEACDPTPSPCDPSVDPTQCDRPLGTLRWATQALTADASIPALAFHGAAALPPCYYVVASSVASGMAERHQHRTSLGQVAGWLGSPLRASQIDAGTQATRVLDGRETVDLRDGSVSTEDDADLLFDGDVWEPYLLTADVLDRDVLYVDLRVPVAVRDVLVFNLAVRNMYNGRVVLRASAADQSNPPSDPLWFELTRAEGSVSLEPWVYLAYSGAIQARWLRLDAEPLGSGPIPFFEAIAEIMVLN